MAVHHKANHRPFRPVRAANSQPVTVRAKVGAVTFTGNVHKGEGGAEYFTYVTKGGVAKVAQKFSVVE